MFIQYFHQKSVSVRNVYNSAWIFNRKLLTQSHDYLEHLQEENRQCVRVGDFIYCLPQSLKKVDYQKLVSTQTLCTQTLDTPICITNNIKSAIDHVIHSKSLSDLKFEIELVDTTDQ